MADASNVVETAAIGIVGTAKLSERAWRASARKVERAAAAWVEAKRGAAALSPEQPLQRLNLHCAHDQMYGLLARSPDWATGE
jgi:hypothetical protein